MAGYSHATSNDLRIRLIAHDRASRAIRSALVGITNLIRNVAIGFGALAAGIGTSIFRIGFAFNGFKERATIAFDTLLRGAVDTKQFLSDLQAFAARTEFTFPGLIDASRRLLAYGIDAKNVVPTLKIISDASSGLGLGQEAINRISLALGQMLAKGKVSAEEMRQIAEAGIRGWEYLSQALGLTISQVRELTERNLLSGETGVSIILAGMKKDFDGLATAMARTWTGVRNVIADNIRVLTSELTKPFFEEARDRLVEFSDKLANPANVEKARELGRKMYELWQGLRKPLEYVKNSILFIFSQISADPLVSEIKNFYNVLKDELLPMLKSHLPKSIDSTTSLIHLMFADLLPLFVRIMTVTARMFIPVLDTILTYGIPTLSKLRKIFEDLLMYVNENERAFKILAHTIGAIFLLNVLKASLAVRGLATAFKLLGLGQLTRFLLGLAGFRAAAGRVTMLKVAFKAFRRELLGLKFGKLIH